MKKWLEVAGLTITAIVVFSAIVSFLIWAAIYAYYHFNLLSFSLGIAVSFVVAVMLFMCYGYFHQQDKNYYKCLDETERRQIREDARARGYDKGRADEKTEWEEAIKRSLEQDMDLKQAEKHFKQKHEKEAAGIDINDEADHLINLNDLDKAMA